MSNLLYGKYKWKGPLGNGQFGVVTLVEYKQKLFALKKIDNEYADY